MPPDVPATAKKSSKGTNLYLPMASLETARTLVKERGLNSISELFTVLIEEERTRPQRNFEFRALGIAVEKELRKAKAAFERGNDPRDVDFILPKSGIGLLLRLFGESDLNLSLQSIAWSAGKFSLHYALIVVPEEVSSGDKLRFSPITHFAATIPIHVVGVDRLAKAIHDRENLDMKE
jgi:hypothetical protein